MVTQFVLQVGVRRSADYKGLNQTALHEIRI